MHTTTPTAALGALALALALGSSVSQAAMFEPPGSQVLMGSWIDTQQGQSSRVCVCVCVCARTVFFF